MIETIQNTNSKFFFINRSEILERLDTQFYKESFDFTDFIKLSKIATVKGGKRIPLGLDYSNTKTEYLYLRVADMNKDNDLDFDSLNFIPKEVYEILKRYEIIEDDLAISIAGTIGKILLLKNIPTNKKIILTENCAKINIKKDIEVLPNYLELILNLPIVQKQIQLNYIQTTIPKLGLDRVKNLMLPQFPGIEKQKEIILFYNKILTQKQQKETQAQELIKSIDTYLLNELGITLPIKNNTAKSRMFISNLSEVTSGRLDPDYQNISYKNIITEIKKSTFPLADLKDITEVLNSGKTPASYEYSEEKTDFPIIKVGSYTNDFINLKKADYVLTKQKLKAQKGDIFILSAAHQSEYVGRHIKMLNEEPQIETSYVGELICVRANEKVNSIFLFSLLKTDIYKTLINREKTGQTSHVYGKDLKKILIPLPDKQIQDKISTQINDKQEQIKTLQADAKRILDEAKQEVEKMIIGN
jgi:type I restriction enzyme S subunit